MPTRSASSTSPTGCRIYAKETNDPSLEPAPLLKRLAAEGKTFASLAQTRESGVMRWSRCVSRTLVVPANARDRIAADPAYGTRG